MNEPGDRYMVPAAVVEQTFAELRRCGRGVSECQVLWLSPWSSVSTIERVVHPKHHAHGVGFELDDAWLNDFWRGLTATRSGIRVQVHTHPNEAFHSSTDDAWPIIHVPGFLSLVIPRFATGSVGFEDAFLARLQTDGTWREVAIPEHFEIV